MKCGDELVMSQILTHDGDIYEGIRTGDYPYIWWYSKKFVNRVNHAAKIHIVSIDEIYQIYNKTSRSYLVSILKGRKRKLKI